jgi:multisubunit Na+/H+ antiporter MnhF subunit
MIVEWLATAALVLVIWLAVAFVIACLVGPYLRDRVEGVEP